MPLDAERERIVAEFLSKTWADLEPLEFAGYLLFPDVVKRRRKDGSFEEIPICLRVPREPELRKARLDARAWAKEEGLDPELDPLHFDNLDTWCILSIAIRNRTEPHEPWEPDPKRLEREYDVPSLEYLWAKLEAYRVVIDPRPEDLGEDETLAVIAMIANTANVAPLAGLGSRAQNGLIVTMARRFLSSQTSK